MQKVQRFRFVAVIGLVVALTTAGFAFAGDNIFDTAEDPQPTVCPPTGGTVDEGDQDESADDEDESTDCEDAADGTDDAEEAEDPAGDVTGDAQTEEFTAEDCVAAAGLQVGDEPTEAPVPGELHGLENATAHLLWNCLDHPNHGLVNALTNHAEKLDAWLAKQELKAERKAEREAAKAERRAEHEAAKAARELSHTS
jgi:hypothetical protein